MSKTLLMIGNFLSATTRVAGVCEELSEKLQSAGWEIYSASTKRNRLLRIIDMVSVTLFHRKQYPIAYIDVFSGASFIWVEIIAKLLTLMKKPYVLVLHGGNLPVFAAQHPERVKAVFSQAAEIVSPSNYLIEAMQSYHPQIKLIPNPLKLNHYSYKPVKPVQREIVWLRALHSIYNPVLALKTMCLLLPDYPDLHLWMVGPTKEAHVEEELRAYSKEHQLDSHVSLTGGVPKAEVPNYIARGSIFLNTTNIDNTPISIMEAMASGLCIVSTDAGGIRYLLEDGVTALLVPPDNPEAMAAAIRRILNEPDLAESLSRNARAKAETFDWSVVLPQWEALFEQLLERQAHV